MSEGTSTINKKVWSMATVLMNDGVSNQDYLEQLTYLLFLKIQFQRRLKNEDGR